MKKRSTKKTRTYGNPELDEAVPGSVPSYRAELGTRIARAAETLGGKRALAAACGVHEVQIYRYIRGENEPTASVLNAVVRATQVNADWLVTGEGPMLKGEGVRVAPLDRGLLRDVIQVVEELQAEAGGFIEPEKKAELIELLYEEFREREGKVDRARILKLVKLAS